MSINLTATNQSLELVTTAAVQTQVVVSARDRAAGADTPVSQDTNITTAATTTIEAAPAAATQRQTDDVEIMVIGAGQQGVKVQKNVGGTVFALLNVSLQTNERAHFTNDMGWRLFDAFGREKGLTVGFSLLKKPTLDLVAGAGKTYTPSIGCTAMLIEGWGPGGQGGGAPVNVANNASAGTGGNAGGRFRVFIIGIPSSFLYTVGAAPTPAAAGAAGATGTNTTAGPINGTTYTALAGTGGNIIATSAAKATAAPPAAVTGTNGDENLPGMQGELASVLSFVAASPLIDAVSGAGGSSDLGSGGPGKSAVTAAGSAATGNAAAGGGAVSVSGGAAQVGGAGTPGGIRFWEFAG